MGCDGDDRSERGEGKGGVVVVGVARGLRRLCLYFCLA